MQLVDLARHDHWNKRRHDIPLLVIVVLFFVSSERLQHILRMAVSKVSRLSSVF